MGRGRVEVKLIQDKQARNVTFSKRKSGLMKKASQLSQLCDAEVALIIASSTGRVFCHGSPDGCMDEIIRRYKSTPEEEEARVKSEYQKFKELHSHLEKLKNKVSALEKTQRNLSGLDLHSLSPSKLERLEKKLAKGIGRIRNQQVKFFSGYKRTALMERSLKKDNARLKMQLERRMQETCNISERPSLQFGYNGKEQRHRAEILQLFYDEGEKAAAARETGNAREIPYIFAWQSQGEGATTAANEEDAYNDHHHVREVPFICSLEPTENQTAVVTSQNGHVRDRDVPNISFLDLRLS